LVDIVYIYYIFIIVHNIYLFNVRWT